MKTLNKAHRTRLLAVVGASVCFCFTLQSDGVPEPGLTMYGTVHNVSMGGARITIGSLRCTVTPTGGGAPIVVMVPLQDMAGGFSYRLRIPFDTLVGSTLLSSNALATTAANTVYERSVELVFDDETILPEIQPGPFQFKTGDHAKVEEMNLSFAAGFARFSAGTFSDRDRDGLSDTDEIRAGTNPDDPNSFLHFTSITHYPRQGIVLEWTSSLGRHYALERCEGPIDPLKWRPLQGGLIATPPISGFLDRSATNSGPYFYKLTVE